MPFNPLAGGVFMDDFRLLQQLHFPHGIKGEGLGRLGNRTGMSGYLLAVVGHDRVLSRKEFSKSFVEMSKSAWAKRQDEEPSIPFGTSLIQK